MLYLKTATMFFVCLNCTKYSVNLLSYEVGLQLHEVFPAGVRLPVLSNVAIIRVQILDMKGLRPIKLGPKEVMFYFLYFFYVF